MILEIIIYALMVAVVVVALQPKNSQDFFKKIYFKKIDFKKFAPNVIKYLSFLLIAAIIIGMFFYAIGMEEDASIVSETIKQFPLIEVMISILLASFAEEILFRGFLVKRTDILVSSFLFAISHAGYGSITEIVGAFALGIILAKQFKEANNLWNVIAVHLLYDILVVIFIFGA